jgi:hypothetical protein
MVLGSKREREIKKHEDGESYTKQNFEICNIYQIHFQVILNKNQPDAHQF